MKTAISLCTALALFACLTGCNDTSTASSTSDELLVKTSGNLVLAEEPTNIIGITELRTMLDTDDSIPTVTESEAAGDEHEHDGDDHDGHDHDAAGHDGHEDAHDHADHDHGAEGDTESHEHVHEDGTACTDENCEHDHGHSDEVNQHVHEDGSVCTDENCEHDHAETAAVTGLGSMDNVTVVGKISAKNTDGGAETSDFPWEKGMATFVMIDPAVEDGEPEHQHKEGEECPFCTKKKIEAQAVVQFMGADGKMIPIDAREMFDLSLEDIVVVHGDAELLGGVLIINADGIYVRK